MMRQQSFRSKTADVGKVPDPSAKRRVCRCHDTHNSEWTVIMLGRWTHNSELREEPEPSRHELTATVPTRLSLFEVPITPSRACAAERIGSTGKCLPKYLRASPHVAG